MSINEKIENLKGKLIVSCQALPSEPLHSPFIMGRMALAAKIGGASGIRANTKEDIAEIQTQVDLPIIGIVKRDYEDSEIYMCIRSTVCWMVPVRLKNFCRGQKSLEWIVWPSQTTGLCMA